MPLFRHDQFVKVDVSKPQTAATDEGRYQYIPCVFSIPNYAGSEVFETPFYEVLWEAQKKLLAPQVKGDMKSADAGPYVLRIWPHSEEKRELEVHLAQPHVLELLYVRIYQIELRDTEDFFQVKAKLEVPWKDKDQAGEIDALAGSTLQAKLIPHQVALDLNLIEVVADVQEKLREQGVDVDMHVGEGEEAETPA